LGVEFLAGGADAGDAVGCRHTRLSHCQGTAGIRDTGCETRNETPRPEATGGEAVAPEGVSLF
jgi:hypothetical protein